MAGSSASAQFTNGQIVTIINTRGETHQNVRVERIEKHGVIWFETNGISGGFARFSEMLPELRDRFGYDPAAERIAVAQEAARRAALIRLNAAPAPAPAPAPSSDSQLAVLQYLNGTTARIADDQARRMDAVNRNLDLRGHEWRMQVQHSRSAR